MKRLQFNSNIMLTRVSCTLSLMALVAAQVTNQSALRDVTPGARAYACIAPGVACIENYSAVMPSGTFNRHSPYDTYLTSIKIGVPFAAAVDASFLVFDRERAQDILGSSPKYQFMYSLPNAPHTAPVYVSKQNKLYFSSMGPKSDVMDQYVLDLNVEPPEKARFRSSPAINAPNGGVYYRGQILWATAGAGSVPPNGRIARPGIYAVNLPTPVSVPILNNYFGYGFSGLNDLTVDHNGDIWFTDATYGRDMGVNDIVIQLRSATYKFRPSTGAVNMVEDSLELPNGIVLSPDERTMYISDTSAWKPREEYSSLKKRTIYAFDVTNGSLMNKRLFWEAQIGVPSGLKVAKNGYVLAASGNGVDILDQSGTLLLRVNTPANFTVHNIAFTGPNLTDLWLIGKGGVARVKWALQGNPGAK